jgi:hypothetical protein
MLKLPNRETNHPQFSVDLSVAWTFTSIRNMPSWYES